MSTEYATKKRWEAGNCALAEVLAPSTEDAEFKNKLGDVLKKAAQKAAKKKTSSETEVIMKRETIICVQLLLMSMLAGLAIAQSSTTTNTKKQQPSVPVWTQEPNGFRGFMFGSSRSDLGFIPQNDYFTAKDSAGNYCTSTEKYRGAGSEKCERTEEPIGNVGVSFRYYFRDDKLVDISGDFNSENYEALRDILIAAYGKARQSQHTVEHTAIGAAFRNETLFWSGKRVTVLITKYLSDINDGEFSISLKSEDAELDRVKRDAKRKAIDSIK